MFQGRPCKNMYPNEYFPHGITNGASWYNVPGKHSFILRPYNLIDFLFRWMVLLVTNFLILRKNHSFKISCKY